eukprot:50206-Hanusia_phi.AAC.1
MRGRCRRRGGSRGEYWKRVATKGEGRVDTGGGDRTEGIVGLADLCRERSSREMRLGGRVGRMKRRRMEERKEGHQLN